MKSGFLISSIILHVLLVSEGTHQAEISLRPQEDTSPRTIVLDSSIHSSQNPTLSVSFMNQIAKKRHSHSSIADKSTDTRKNRKRNFDNFDLLPLESSFRPPNQKNDIRCLMENLQDKHSRTYWTAFALLQVLLYYNQFFPFFFNCGATVTTFITVSTVGTTTVTSTSLLSEASTSI